MPRYAQITDNVVTNVIVADEIFIEQFVPNAIQCPDLIGVGDIYRNGIFEKKVVIKDESETL